MTRLTALIIVMFVARAAAGEWTDPAVVEHRLEPCVTYRAKLAGDLLAIQVTHEPGWHTYAMDNEKRAQEKLAGRRSLGIDRPTKITVGEGLEVTGSWFQPPPIDLSKPKLRWYSWGFEGQILFATKVKRLAGETAKIGIRGQACTDTTCKEIDLSITLPVAEPGPADIDLDGLIQVR